MPEPTIPALTPAPTDALPSAAPTTDERVAANLNRALHAVMASDPRAWVLGEDIEDPYGGAFKVTRGLSGRFPDRVIGTPISESGIVGVAGGLAMCGERPIVEVMFGDFLALAFDQILNFLSKSVAMYGDRLPMHAVIRCPVGGHRGYGPTHSQSLQKYVVGIPHLWLFELSPFHDSTALLTHLLDLGEPAILFENKILYTERMHTGGLVDDLFIVDRVGGCARLSVVGVERPDVVVIAAGGAARRTLAAARELFMRREVACQVIVPVQLHPFPLEPLLPLLRTAGRVCVVEEDVPGATWGTEVAHEIHTRLWDRLRVPVALAQSRGSVIPTARHLEEQVVLTGDTIVRTLMEVADA